jgi:hypothetical protein
VRSRFVLEGVVKSLEIARVERAALIDVSKFGHSLDLEKRSSFC